MANELVNIELPKLIVNRIVDEATPIPLGTLMQISTSPNTVTASSGNEDKFGGITTEEFTGGEGLTHVACAMDGVWDVLTTGSATLGTHGMIGAANQLTPAIEADYPLGTVCCKFEETASGADTVRCRFFNF